MANTIGKRISELRNENNYTKKQVADYLGFGQNRLVKLENDEASLNSSTLNKLCELYGCTPEYILEGSSKYYMEPISYENNLDLHTLSNMNRIIGNLKKLNELNGLK